MANGIGGLMMGMGGAASLGTLFVRLNAETTGLTRGMNQAERTVMGTTRNITRAVAGMGAAVAGSMAVIGAASVREFGKFDAAMTRSTAIMGDLQPQLRREMEETARTLATQGVQSAEELAESYFFLASAGLDAERSIGALPTVQKFATAGAFDMAQATDLLTDAQSALGLTVDDTAQNMENMTRVADVLVKANTLANATVEQFSTSLTREAGAALKSFNIDVEEGVAVLAAFADQGVKGEIAGTGLSRVLRLMSQAAVNNKEELAALNVEVFDSQGNMNNLGEIIADLEGALGGMSDAQRVAALESIGFTARVQGMILPLLGTSDAIADYEKELRDAGGTTEEVADKQLESFNNQLTITFNRVKEVMISIGEGLAPIIRSFNDVVLNATDSTAGFADTTQKISDIFSTALIVSIGAVGNAIQGWQLLIAASRLQLIYLAEGAVASFEVATRGITFLIEGTANAVISGVNMALNVMNRMIDSLPDWMTPGISKVPTIEWELDIDTSSVENATETLRQTRLELQQEFTDKLDQELFSTKMLRQLEEDRDRVEIASQDVVTSLQIMGDRTQEIADEMGIPRFTEQMIETGRVGQESFSMLSNSTEDVVASFQRATEAAEETDKTYREMDPPPWLKDLGNQNFRASSSDQIGGFSAGGFGTADRLSRQAESLLQQEEQLQEHYNREREIILESGKNEEELLDQLNQNKLQQEREFQKAKARIAIQSSEEMFGDIATITAAFAGEQSDIYKGMFAISKTFAIADATISMFQGAAKALTLPFPANIAAMAQVAAAGASIVSNIQAIQMAGQERSFLGGGFTGDGPRSGGLDGQGGFLATVHPNERIIDLEKDDDPRERGGNVVNVTVNNHSGSQVQVNRSRDGRDIEILVQEIENTMSQRVANGQGPMPKAIRRMRGSGRI